MPSTRIPSATYRIQLNQRFRFADTLKILDYLHQLGISMDGDESGFFQGHDRRKIGRRADSEPCQRDARRRRTLSAAPFPHAEPAAAIETDR